MSPEKQLTTSNEIHWKDPETGDTTHITCLNVADARKALKQLEDDAEQRRGELVSVFNLPEDASWEKIKEAQKKLDEIASEDSGEIMAGVRETLRMIGPLPSDEEK